jgi:putative transposase
VTDAPRLVGETSRRHAIFYWRSEPPTIRELRHEQLSGLISDIHHASRGTYGYRRIAAELGFAHEITANHKAVALLMRRLGLQGLPARKARRKGAAERRERGE